MLSLPVSAPAQSMTGQDGSASGGKLKHSDRRFLEKVADSNRAEIALANLAATQASNQRVKDFAQKLVTDHQQVTQELQQLAQQKGIDLPEHGSRASAAASYNNTGDNRSGLNDQPDANGSRANTNATNPGAATGRDHDMSTASTASDDLSWGAKHDYNKLSKESGADFDKKFINDMVDDHQEDIKMFEKKAKDADDPQVRDFASRVLPHLQEHLQMAQDLKNQLG